MLTVASEIMRRIAAGITNIVQPISSRNTKGDYIGIKRPSVFRMETRQLRSTGMNFDSQVIGPGIGLAVTKEFVYINSQ